MAILLAVAGGLLAGLTPARPWPLLRAAFGLGASVGAPAALLACWSERVSARGLGAGAGAGLLLFAVLSAIGLTGAFGVARAPDEAWLRWLTDWPALAAAPAGALTAWLVSPRPPAAAHGALPPGLAGLHD